MLPFLLYHSPLPLPILPPHDFFLLHQRNDLQLHKKRFQLHRFGFQLQETSLQLQEESLQLHRFGLQLHSEELPVDAEQEICDAENQKFDAEQKKSVTDKLSPVTEVYFREEEQLIGEVNAALFPGMGKMPQISTDANCNSYL